MTGRRPSTTPLEERLFWTLLAAPWGVVGAPGIIGFGTSGHPNPSMSSHRGVPA